ncbi:hypothetical protein ACIQ9R_23130 [Streptomyces sp. NPDC094447]|uniref:hypothetical protein n=1 Tax=Streptomyces sp. NPDC094447 TaxID=3366062 RepID=UPI00380D6B05
MASKPQQIGDLSWVVVKVRQEPALLLGHRLPDFPRYRLCRHWVGVLRRVGDGVDQDALVRVQRGELGRREQIEACFENLGEILLPDCSPGGLKDRNEYRHQGVHGLLGGQPGVIPHGDPHTLYAPSGLDQFVEIALPDGVGRM